MVLGSKLLLSDDSFAEVSDLNSHVYGNFDPNVFSKLSIFEALSQQLTVTWQYIYHNQIKQQTLEITLICNLCQLLLRSWRYVTKCEKVVILETLYVRICYITLYE